MKLRKIALSLAAGVIVALTTGTAAHATTVSPSPSPSAQDCRTVTTTLLNRPDNGHGTPGHWANDNLTRKLTVCHVTAQIDSFRSVTINTWIYSAYLTDTGTFTTIPGAHNSPNNAAALATATGTVTGIATFDLFTAPHDWIAWDDTAINNKTFDDQGSKTDPSSTGKWVSLVWKDGYDGKGTITNYGWTYKTCTEQWVDANTNNDGTDTSAGDITGTPCPSPSPSATRTAPATTHASAAVSPLPAGLPVTGTNLPVLLGAGIGVILIGTGVLILFRRRR